MAGWLGPESPADDPASPSSNMGWRRVETQADVSVPDTNSRINMKDIGEVIQSLASEVTRPGIVGAELCLKILPRNHGWFPQIAHPVGEPGVEVDGERRSLQLTDRSEIHGDGRTRDLFGNVLAQDDVRSPCWSAWEQLSQRLQPRSTTRSHECGARGSGGESHGGLPFEPHAKKATKLLLEAMGCASGSANHREPELASQIIWCSAKLDHRTLGPDRLCGQVGKKQPRIGTVGEADAPRCAQAKGMPAVDPLESVALWPAMGEGGEDQEARHEAEGTGRQRVY